MRIRTITAAALAAAAVGGTTAPVAAAGGTRCDLSPNYRGGTTGIFNCMDHIGKDRKMVADVGGAGCWDPHEFAASTIRTYLYDDQDRTRHRRFDLHYKDAYWHVRLHVHGFVNKAQSRFTAVNRSSGPVRFFYSVRCPVI